MKTQAGGCGRLILFVLISGHRLTIPRTMLNSSSTSCSTHHTLFHLFLHVALRKCIGLRFSTFSTPTRLPWLQSNFSLTGIRQATNSPIFDAIELISPEIFHFSRSHKKINTRSSVEGMRMCPYELKRDHSTALSSCLHSIICVEFFSLYRNGSCRCGP